MPKEFSRGKRIADLIAHELAMLIQQEVKDPRVGMVTINDVRVSRDLAYADIYFTMLGQDDHKVATQVLTHAAGFLRSQLAKVLSTRTTPRLRFHYDNTIEQGQKISKAISDALESDRRLHQDEADEGNSE